MKTNTIMQMGLETAYALHRNINKSDIGEAHYEEWTTLCSILAKSAYESWADTHDIAGKPIETVNTDDIKLHNDILFELLHKVVTLIGEVKFSDDNTAKLSVDTHFAELTRGAAKKLGWKKSDVLEQIEEDIYDTKQSLKFATEDFERYNFAGISEELKTAKREAVDKLAVDLEVLKTAKREAEKIEYNKTRAYVPCSDAEFRKNFETLIHDMVECQNATSYTEYRAKKEEQRKARRAKTKAKKQARKAEEQAEA